MSESILSNSLSRSVNRSSPGSKFKVNRVAKDSFAPSVILFRSLLKSQLMIWLHKK